MADVIVATQLRVGNIIEHEGSLYKIFHMDHVTPGKGRGHVQVKIKALEAGTQREIRFRSDEKVTKAFLDQRELEFLYSDGSEFHFMDNQSYEQISLPKQMLEEAAPYMKANTTMVANFYDSKPVGIELPVAVDLEVTSTGQAMKGATVTNQFKPATLETGVEVQVPPFIKEGDIVRIETSTGKYMERVGSSG